MKSINHWWVVDIWRHGLGGREFRLYENIQYPCDFIYERPLSKDQPSYVICVGPLVDYLLL